MHILFVCTGNTCRSCMAEGILRAAVSDNMKISVSSAGIAAFEGDAASMNSVLALKDEWGIDISSHRSRRISREMVDEADLILTMTRGHRDSVIRIFPEAESKTFTLKEFAENGSTHGIADEYNYAADILDPYGMSLQVYKKCAKGIKESINKLLPKLEG